jgi:uncharacterized ion transporter superfamily protein YfcC
MAWNHWLLKRFRQFREWYNDKVHSGKLHSEFVYVTTLYHNLNTQSLGFIETERINKINKKVGRGISFLVHHNTWNGMCRSFWEIYGVKWIRVCIWYFQSSHAPFINFCMYILFVVGMSETAMRSSFSHVQYCSFCHASKVIRVIQNTLIMYSRKVQMRLKSTECLSHL